MHVCVAFDGKVSVAEKWMRRRQHSTKSRPFIYFRCPNREKCFGLGRWKRIVLKLGDSFSFIASERAAGACARSFTVRQQRLKQLAGVASNSIRNSVKVDSQFVLSFDRYKNWTINSRINSHTQQKMCHIIRSPAYRVSFSFTFTRNM